VILERIETSSFVILGETLYQAYDFQPLKSDPAMDMGFFFSEMAPKDRPVA
jgi:hypothetical protein